MDKCFHFWKIPCILLQPKKEGTPSILGRNEYKNNSVCGSYMDFFSYYKKMRFIQSEKWMIIKHVKTSDLKKLVYTA